MTDLKELIIEELKKTQSVLNISLSKINHYVRCPYCGDSLNPNHAHLSMKIDISDPTSPMLFRCLRCNTSGMVTETLLEDIGVFLDSETKKNLRSYTKRSMKLAKLVNLNVERFFVPLSNEDSLTSRKIEYVRDRLGIDLDVKSAVDYKIILNFFDFIKANELIDDSDRYLLNLDYNTICNLHNHYVGFLACNNNAIIFRSIDKDSKMRYRKVILNERNVNNNSFYSIPTKLNLMYTNPVDIHVAEGIFDILSIKENIVKDLTTNFYYATCGFGSSSILRYIVNTGLNTDLSLHIYSDNDKSDWDHLKYIKNKSYLLEWVDHIYIHRNTFSDEKDYGVTSNHIIDSKRKIK